ncbi:MAG TPA: hypothetical protein VKD72_22850, partial [Gemmataceae bacterium]|nr:hypothetical protein [Gemmataceae bacterium]
FGDVFHDYVCETYLCNTFARDVHARFGERSLAEWFVPELTREVSTAMDELEPFACRYYRFNLPAGVRWLDARVSIPYSPPVPVLRATALAVDPAGKEVDRHDLTPAAAPPGVDLAGRMSLVGLNADHIAVVVANIPKPDDNVLFSDLNAVQEYTLRATVT